MDSRGRLTWMLVLGVCALTPMVKSQTQVCSIEGIDLLQCLNQGNRSSTDMCCKTLNQVVQAGYNCLCFLVASSIPLLTTPISLPLSNCYISVPPLTLCRVLAPMPVMLPPPKELIQPFAPTKSVPLPLPLPPPPREMQVRLNSTTVAPQPNSIENSVPESNVSETWNDSSNGEVENKMLLIISLFLSLALYRCTVLA